MKRIWLTMGGGIILVYSLLPLYWAFNTSLKTGGELFENRLFPLHPVWKNYYDIFKEQPFGENIFNSAAVALLTVGVSLMVGLLASYALGRIRFKGRWPMMVVFLSVSMFPQIAVLAGLFELIQTLHLYDHIGGLVLSYMIFTLPFTIWVLTSFIKEIPKALEEAAMIDGASPLTMIFKIFLPLMRPALISSGLLAFIGAWNEFLFALTLTLSNQARTVPVAIALISGASQFELPWGQIMAAAMIVTVPLIVLVVIFQRRIVSGLLAGSVKG